MNANNPGSEGEDMEKTSTSTDNEQQDVTENTEQEVTNAVDPASTTPTAEEPVADESPDEPSDDTPPNGTVSETEVATSTSDAPSSTTEEATEAPAAPEPARPPARFQRGEVVVGTIKATAPTQITVDLGEGDEGLILARELEHMTTKAIEELVEGSEIKVFIVNPNDHQGRIILSVNRAIEEQNWVDAEVYRENQEVFEGNVAGYNRGGLIVRFGRLRGFVPQSQIAEDRRRNLGGDTPEERFGGMVGQNVFVKVMEVDRSRNRLILSERAAARERREQRKEELIDELTVGQIVEGKVVSLEDFGAFVDVGGAEGLVHLTEATWKHITHPREALKIGQRVRVEVISVDSDRKRIGLSIKRQEADPWDEVATTYAQGELVEGTVTKLAKFGAFARLVEAPDIEGLIHISELSENRVGHPREVVDEGDRLTLRVVKVDVKNRRLGLSLKRVNSAEYLDMDMQRFAKEAENMNIPAEEEAPAEEAVAEVEAPAEDEAPAEEAVAEVEAPAEDEAPAEEAVAEVEAPAEDEAPAEEEEPVEESDD